MTPFFKLAASVVLGVGFFIFPFEAGGRSTVFFDIVVKYLTKGFPNAVGWYCLGLVSFGAIGTVVANQSRKKRSFWSGFQSPPLFTVIRIMGAILAALMFFEIGPAWLINKKVSGLIWGILVKSVGVIIPIGAIFLNIFIAYGFLEFVGTLMRPIMRPLFRLPGRSALDDLTSWLGSYSVGLYVTKKLANQGYYNRQEVVIILTCFSTVSMGFVGIVASTLDLLHLFPLIFATYGFVIYFLAAILVRLWPINTVPKTYLVKPQREPEVKGNLKTLVEAGAQTALSRARKSKSYFFTVREGFTEGLKLASTVLGSILTIGTLAVLIVNHTALFEILGKPLVPVLELLGLPDANLLAPASLVGITEMYIPALMLKSASIPAKFFIAVLSISQLIFFSSIGPMMIDMFKEIPIRFADLVVLFFLRTALLIPILALLVKVYESLGWLG